MRTKLSNEEFLRIKKELFQKIDDYLNNSSNVPESEDKEQQLQVLEQQMEQVYIETMTKLLSYDLSEVPFESWEGFVLASLSDKTLNFEGTNANIDFSIVEISNGQTYNFKTCKIRNLGNAFGLVLREDCFDEEVCESNKTLFLTETNLSRDLLNKAHTQSLEISDLIANLEELTPLLISGAIKGVHFKNESFGRLLDRLDSEQKKYALTNKKEFILSLLNDTSIDWNKCYFVAPIYTQEFDFETLICLIVLKLLEVYPNIFLYEKNVYKRLNDLFGTENISFKNMYFCITFPDPRIQNLKELLSTVSVRILLELDKKTKGALSSNSFINLLVAANYLPKNNKIRDTKELMEAILKHCILQRKINYNDSFERFRPALSEIHPELYLNNGPEELKEKFKNKSLSLDYLRSHPEILSFFSNTDIFAGFDERFSVIASKRKAPYTKESNETALLVIEEAEKIIDDDDLRDQFLEYCGENFEKLTSEKIKAAAEVIKRLLYSNSGKLTRIRRKIAQMLLDTDDPMGNLNKIEEIYLTNYLPDVAKTFLVFKVLHSKNGELELNLQRHSSPVLKANSTSLNEKIIFSDLIRTAIESNDISLREYIRTLEEGERLTNELAVENYNSFTPEQKRILNRYSSILCALYNQSSLSSEQPYTLTNNTPQDILFLINKLGAARKINDRIVRMFLGFIEINDLDSLKEYMRQCVETRNRASMTLASKGLKLEKGDFVKGLRQYKFFYPTVEHGALATEFLGSDASEKGDRTPLDTDFGIVLEPTGTLEGGLENTMARAYAPVWLIIKANNPKIYISRSTEGGEKPEYVSNKIEMFQTLERRYWGCRVGLGSTNPDSYITQTYNPKMGFAFIRQGFYTPIYGLDEKLLFTPEDFKRYTAQMEGLTYYGYYSYTVSESLCTPEICQIAKCLDANEEDIKKKSDHIMETFRKAFAECGLKVKTEMDGVLEEGTIEVIDTGSTGRGTNEFGDSDFDYIFRVDNSIMKDPKRLREIKETVRKALNQEDATFKYESVSIDGLDTPVKIEISWVHKTDEMSYSTDSAIRDRLATIKRVSPDSYNLVIANIIYAKKILKKYLCYSKHGHKGYVYGGLGGVGVENWILSHHGSFIEAAEDFLAVAEKCPTFDDFKKVYKVWDFGENFYSVEQKEDTKYDEFVHDNMDSDGYLAMKKGLAIALNQIKINEQTLDGEVVDLLVEKERRY